MVYKMILNCFYGDKNYKDLPYYTRLVHEQKHQLRKRYFVNYHDSSTVTIPLALPNFINYKYLQMVNAHWWIVW